MAILPERTFVAYARPTRERIVLELLNERASSGLSVPGFALSLTNAAPANVATVLAKLPKQTPLRLLLPEIDLLPRDKQPTRPVHAFTNSVPPISWTATQATSWLREVAAAQVTGGASAIVTPSVLIESSHGDVELRRMLEWAAVIRGLKIVDSLPVATGLTLHRDWLGKDEKRETLLNVLTDADDPTFYVLVRWPAEPNYGQVAEQAALAGYREAVSVLRQTGKEVIVARSGLGGFVVTAVGAAGFVAGIYPSHVYRDPVIRRRAPGSKSPPRISHYLDAKLLGYVPSARLRALAGIAGPSACGCSYCQLLAGGGYDDKLGFKHLLGAYTELARTLEQAQNPRLAARRRVVDALALISNNPGLGLPAHSAGHLGVWRDALS